MNKQYVDVYIEWQQESISHVEIPSEGIRFCPQIRFEDEVEILPKWTAEIIIRSWGINSSCYAELKYLFSTAPNYLLKKGNKFIIFDGPNIIANGEVLSNL